MNSGYLLYFLAGGLLLWLTVWCIYDAFDRTDYGFVWLALFIMGPPIFIPIYLFMRFYSDRPASRQEMARREMERERWRDFRLSGDIEKAKFMESAELHGGTLYDPNAHLQQSSDGFRHFTDQRAESMLTSSRFDEAWDYLIDLYAIAQNEGDVRALDTYRHYISRLPGGLALLSQWEQGQRTDAGAGVARPLAPGIGSGSLGKSSSKRSLPF